MIELDKQANIPTAEDIKLAKESAKKIAALKPRSSKKPYKYMITDGKGMAIRVCEPAFRILAEALKEIADGKAVAITSIETELTTQQAANLLNFSRPYLVNLLEAGEIPYRNVGRYRRIRYKDILHYQQESEKKREAAMDELVAQAQELGLGY